MSKFLLSVSILSADFTRLGEQIHAAEAAGADWIHIDVMDGHFVPNITMGPFIVEACRQTTRIPLDVHLMIENPERMVEAYAAAGATYITVHVENNPNVHRTIQFIRSLGCHPGVAINPGTAACNLAAILASVDMVLVMTVNPGYSGQVFLPETVSKIAEVRKLITDRGFQTLLQVDGGLTEKTLPAAHAAGANVVVAATAVFKHPAGIAAGVQKLRASLD